MKKANIAIVGCGNISDIYFSNLTQAFDNVNVLGCCDLYKEKALEKQEKYNIEKVYDSFEEIICDDKVDIIVVLTQPKYHYSLCLQALKNNKHVYVEKPLSLTKEEGSKLKEIANSKNLFAGGAPDTFLGAGIQTCKSLIDEGWIGDIIGFSANLKCHGHEHWHPDPEFYYQVGGGPMFDMGPYYLTAIVSLLGPVKSVAGKCIKGFDERIITSQKKHGKKIKVDIPTHVTGLLNMASGAVGTITTSFDVWNHTTPHIEIYGTLGSLSVPDPNTFGGTVRYQRKREEWSEIPLIHDYAENSRGLGVSNMADAIISGTEPKANIDLTYHVLDIMESIHISSEKNTIVKLDDYM